MIGFSRIRTHAATFAAVVFGLVFVLAFHTSGKLIRPELLFWLIWLVPCVVYVRIACRSESLSVRKSGAGVGPVMALGLAMTVFLVSSATAHGWFYFLGWAPGTGPGWAGAGSGVVWFVLLTALVCPFVISGVRKPLLLTGIILAFSQVLCVSYLFQATGGAPLYRDDHPSFMFRLYEFAATFPQLINYNPYWNGGVVDNVGATSGTIAFGLPFWGVLRIFPVQQVYTLLFALVYIVFMPWIAVLSVRVAGGRWSAGMIGGLLTMGVSRQFFLWALHYGTIGACFATSFVVLVCAALFRLVMTGCPQKKFAVVLVLASFFLMLWPPGAIMGVIAGLGVIFNVRRLTIRKTFWLLACVLAALGLYWRNLAVLLGANADLFSFVLDSGRGGTTESVVMRDGIFTEGLRYLFDHIHEMNPLLIFFGIGGLICCRHRLVRRWYLPVFLGFAAMTAWGRDFAPNLQLRRMALPLAFSVVVPAAFVLDRVLRSSNAKTTVLRGMILALLVLSGWNVGKLYGNQGRESYVTCSDLVRDMCEWASENTATDERVLFAGKTVHICGRGHAAILPCFTGREMMACDYYAFPMGMVEYEYPPRKFHKPESRVFDFLDLYNVGGVLTYHEYWKEFFRRHPDLCEESRSFDTCSEYVITAFRLKRHDSTIFVKGSGKVTAGFNVIEVDVDDPSQQVVLRYNWVEGLSTEGSARVFSVDMGDGIEFIGLDPQGQDTCVIRFDSL